MRRLLLPLVLALSLGGCGWVGRSDETSKPDGFLLHGYVSVSGAAPGTTGTPCLAPAGVSDVAAGATVRIADADGHVIAATALAGGVLAQDGDGFHCNFAFEQTGLSGSRAAYQVLVGGRPGTTFTTKELREGRPAVVPVAPVTGSSSPS